MTYQNLNCTPHTKHLTVEKPSLAFGYLVGKGSGELTSLDPFPCSNQVKDLALPDYEKPLFEIFVAMKSS